MNMHHGWRKLLVVGFIAACAALLACVVVPRLYRAQHVAYGRGQLRDLEQVRGMGNAFSMYAKKFGAFPTLAAPPTAAESAADRQTAAAEFLRQRANGGKPACLALKLLLSCGYVEDVMTFFCPLDENPTAFTREAMSKNLDPRADPTWAGTFAYDPGHRPQHGSTVMFGDRQEMLVKMNLPRANVLTCEMVAKELESDDDDQFCIRSPRADTGAAADDDIYKDEAAIFAEHDSFLVWDVPIDLP